MYPCIVSDEMLDADKDQYKLDMDIVKAPFLGKKVILIVQDMFTHASKNISPEESAKTKFHDTETPLTRPDIN